MAEVIRVVDLVKIYRMGDAEVRALNGVSLSVQTGEFVAVMVFAREVAFGTSSAADRLDLGRYFLDGHDVSELSRDERAEIRNAKIGFVSSRSISSADLASRTSAPPSMRRIRATDLRE